MMSVNETRAKDLVAAIDELTSVRGFEITANLFDTIASDKQVGIAQNIDVLLSVML